MPPKGSTNKKRLTTLLKVDAKELFGKPDVRRMLSHLISNGMTANQIATKYGSTTVSVRGWLKRLGLASAKVRPNVTERLRILGYSSWNEFFRRNMTMTHMDAAKMLNAHWTTISAFRRRWASGENI